MLDAIGSTVADVARALAAAKQSVRQDDGGQAAAASAAPGRTGHEGDSITISQEARQRYKLEGPDGQPLKPLTLTPDMRITPQGLRGKAEAGMQAILSDLGIDGDVEFSVSVNDDGSIAVQSEDAPAEALESAINADPALQKTLRQMEQMSGHALTMPEMRKIVDWQHAHEDEIPPAGQHDGWRALQDRLGASSYRVTMVGGTLTTAFVDPAGERFGGIGTETGLDGSWF